MIQVIPAIIAESKESLSRQMDVARGITDWVQVDVMDGVFVPPKTWPYSAGLPADIAELKQELKVEVHLMVSNPETVISEWIHSGADRVLIHAESTKEIGVIIDTLKNAGIECGITLNLKTPSETIDPWIGDLSVVQLMAIAEIGYHGKPFDPSVIPKLQALRLKYPELTIQIDGGLSIENAMRLVECGVDGVVVGGAVFNTPDPRMALAEFKQNIERDSE